MARWFPFRLFATLMTALLLCAAGGHADARTVLELDVRRQPVPLADWGDFWIDSTGKATPADILRLRDNQFQPTLPGGIYRTGPGQALWIRFSVPAAPDAERWYLKAPNAGLDRITLFTRGAHGWSSDVAGDKVAVADWPLPNLYPVLPLAVSATEPSYYMLRIESSNVFSTPLLFESESNLSGSQHRLSLLHGVYFGLIAMLALLAMVNAAVMRDMAYVWFSLYAISIVAAIASVMGVAGLHLWPHSPEWNDAAEYVLPTLNLAPLLMFVAHAVSLRARAVRVYWLFCLLAVLSVLAAIAVGLLPNPQRRHVELAAVLSFSLVCLGGMGWSWYHGDRFARWLLLAFAPMVLALPFPVARSLQWLPFGFLTQHSLQMALAITLPAIFLLMILRSQERSDYRKRITRLDQMDPLTGLVNDNVFAHRLRAMIERSQRFHYDSAVVLVDFTNLHRLREEFGRKAVLEVLLRLAGRLTSMVRDVDTVARIGDARYGILIEGPVPRERAAALGSKVLARLILPFDRMPQGLAVRPKVAVALVPVHGVSVDEVLERLDAMLKGASPDYRRNIFVADATQPAPLSES